MAWEMGIHLRWESGRGFAAAWCEKVGESSDCWWYLSRRQHVQKDINRILLWISHIISHRIHVCMPWSWFAIYHHYAPVLLAYIPYDWILWVCLGIPGCGLNKCTSMYQYFICIWLELFYCRPSCVATFTRGFFPEFRIHEFQLCYNSSTPNVNFFGCWSGDSIGS